MSSKILAICDTEETYADMLTKQLLRIPGNRLEIRKFTDVEKLKVFSKDKMIAHLLLSEQYKEMEPEIEYLSCYYLTDKKECCERKIKDQGNQEYLFRYQSAIAIYERISGQVVIDKDAMLDVEVEQEFQFVGVFTPVRRNGQTSFARALAKYLGRRSAKVLYINMDEISEGVERLCDPDSLASGEGNLADLMYYMKQSPEQVIDQLNKNVYKGKNYDTVAPVEIFTELGKVNGEEWQQLMEVLKNAGYQSIILDMDSHIDGYLDLLESCNKVYVPKIKGREHIEKEYSFNQALKILGRNQLLIKMESVEMEEYSSDVELSLIGDMPQLLVGI